MQIVYLAAIGAGVSFASYVLIRAALDYRRAQKRIEQRLDDIRNSEFAEWRVIENSWKGK